MAFIEVHVHFMGQSAKFLVSSCGNVHARSLWLEHIAPRSCREVEGSSVLDGVCEGSELEGASNHGGVLEVIVSASIFREVKEQRSEEGTRAIK